MNKSTILSGIFFILFSFQGFSQSSSSVIWKGKGDVAQSISHIVPAGKHSKLFYKFKNVRYATMVDSGSFYIDNQKDLIHFIEALKGAIKKSKEPGSFEWSNKKYTVKSGGNNSTEKGSFKIFIGDNFCPMDKKNAKKIIKAIEPILEKFKKEEH
tara:strand:+ start:963 stop:1427 length:465 start_codon:yes stop_codon:yes gene_type:complete